MERLYLEVPSIKRKEEALAYLKENKDVNSDFNGTGGMEMCLDGISYEEWLNELERRNDEAYLEKINHCKSKTFFVIRDTDDKIVGMLNVRYLIPKDKLNSWASHIGYGIRPSERGKGYAKTTLYLGLLEEKKLKEDKVLLVCYTDNIPSNKTIMALGGKLDNTKLDEYDGMMTNYYLIDVNQSLKDNYEFYKDHIIIDLCDVDLY